MEIVAMPPAWSQSGSELLSTLDTLKAAMSLLKTYELQVIGRLDEMGTAQELGARDTVELLALRYRTDRAEVRKDLTFAGCLHKYPAVTAALPDPGDPSRPAVLSPEQAKVIVTTLEKAPSTVPVEHLTVAEQQMVEAARVANPRELARFGHKVLATLDTDGPEPAEDEARAKESLRLRRSDGGVKFTGFLAGDSAELFETQIHKLSKPHKTIDGKLDPRPRPRPRDKRQADALKALLDAAAGNPDHPGVPHLTVTIDYNDLKTAIDAPNGVPATGNPGTGLGSGAVGELVFGGNLSAAAVRLMACDAAVLPIVLGGDSQPLDIGTEQRFVNRYLRRALNKRDKGCVVCKAPPWMCHAHHLIHWADGGPTSLNNLALLCALHHRAVHAGQWTITITDGIVHVTRPTWADPPPTDLTTLANLITWNTPAHNAGRTSAGSSTASSAHTNADKARSPIAGTSTSLTGTSLTGASTSMGNPASDIWSSAASANSSHRRRSSSTSDGQDSISRPSPGSATATTGSATRSVPTNTSADNNSVSTSRVSSNPTHEHPTRLPAASTLPNPTLAAAREALRTRLTALVPNHSDPWAAPTPTSDP
ncbi:DUF222 domain-containing protein [Kribbella sp. NPDC005582]|uniref:HNH endonuclease signature motif containing protein n=1 Tax=Kribbella sp. NPDC005582 TaxID=3156893 RepID=UPI0033AC47CF